MAIYGDIGDPGVVSWLAVGAVAGLLAGRVVRGTAYGLVGDVVVGMAGGAAGGFLFGRLATGPAGFAGGLLAAFAGAGLAIWLARAVAPVRFDL